MNIIEALLLGLVQGVTEFIPVSSSGHLLLGQELFGVDGGGLRYDVALHIGTLVAILLFFWRDLYQIIKDVIYGGAYRRVGWFLAIATLPAAFFGALLQGAAESSFRSGYLVAFNLAFVGLLMLLAERLATKQPQVDVKQTNLTQALVIGFSQALALVPGVSRSGSTITAGLFMGLDRVAATRFSFLLAVPIMIGAILKVVVFDSGSVVDSTGSGVLLVGIGASMLSGLLAIRFLLRFLAHHSLATFAYYRIGLAVITVVFLTIR